MKLKDCLEEQVNIVAISELTMLFLKVYKNNPKEFYMLFDKRLMINFAGEDFNYKNIDEVYEFCKSISEEIINPSDRHFHMNSYVLEFSDEVDENLLDDIYRRFSPLSNYSWSGTSLESKEF